MTDASGRRALFLAATTVALLLAVGVAFSGSAAAEVTSIDGVTAEDTTAGDETQVENVTLNGVNKVNSNVSVIDVNIENATVFIQDVRIAEVSNFDSSNVFAGTGSEGEFIVEIEGNDTPTGDITVEVTLDTTGAEPGTAEYSAASNAGASASTTFQIQADDDGSQSDGVLTVSGDDTIANALENAEDGDTVRVEDGDGVYTSTEGLTITTPNVTLTAAEGDSPAFRVRPNSVSGTAAIDVQAEGVTISGLTVERVADGGRTTTDGHAQGIIIRDSNVTVENNDVVGDLSDTSNEVDRFDGITVIDPSDGGTTQNVDIINNDISGFDTGIVTTVFYDGAVSDVTISDTNATDNRIGFVAKSHGGSISGISGSNNDFTGSDAESIVFSPQSFQEYNSLESISTTAVNFDGPVLVEDGDSVQTAIDVSAAGGTIEIGTGNYSDAINVSDTSDLVIKGAGQEQTIIRPDSTLNWGEATLFPGRTTGVRVVDSPNTTFRNLTLNFNRINDTAITGLLYWESSGTLESATVREMSDSDRAVDITSYLGTNNPSNSDYSASNRAEINIRDSKFIETGRIGINAEDFTSVTVDNNSFETTDAGYAVEVGSEATGVVRDNNITGYNQRFGTGAAGAGIYVENAFPADGVDLTKNVGVINNTVTDSLYGVQFGQSFPSFAGDVDIRADFRNNTVSNNELGGVVVTDANASAGSSVTLNADGNTIKNNSAPAYAINTSDRVNSGNVNISVDISGETISNNTVGVVINNTDPDGENNIEVTNSEFSENTVQVSDKVGNEIAIRDTLNNSEFDRAAVVENGSGSLGNTIYSQIQSAVDNASSGDIVSVSDGTYNESVDANVQHITLAGPNAGTPGDVERSEEAIIRQGVKLNASGVTLDGFQVETNGTNGVRIGPEVVPDDVTIQNNVITNVGGGDFLRNNEPAGAGNGIQVQFNNGEPTGETAENLRILNNEINNVTTLDTPGRTTAVGINILPRGNDVELNITGNTITDIQPGNSSGDTERSRAISVDTQFDGAIGNGDENSNPDNFTGRAVELVISDNEITDITSGDRVRAVALFEDGRVEDFRQGISQREGPEDFVIADNEFDDISAPGGFEAAVFIGGYNDLGDHAVSGNNIEEGAIFRFAEPQEGFSVEESDDLNAVLNWWGEDATPRASDDVIYDPLLTVPREQASDNIDDVRNYGSYIELEVTDGATLIGFPAPSEDSLGELLDEDIVEAEDGSAVQAFVYDNADGEFESIDGSFTPTAGEVIAITTEDGLSDEFVVPVETDPAAGVNNPGQTQLGLGYNLVAGGAANDVDEFGVVTSDPGNPIIEADVFQTQARQPGAPEATFGAYSGTWILTSDGTLSTGYNPNTPPSVYFDEVLVPAEDNEAETPN